MYTIGQRLSTFNYVDDTRLPRTASLTSAHYPSTRITESGTNDPQWNVYYADNGRSDGPFDYLTYLGQDMQTYLIWIHAEYQNDGNYIKIWASHQVKDGPNHDDSNYFVIRDWDNNPVRLLLDERLAGRDGTPQFTVVAL